MTQINFTVFESRSRVVVNVVRYYLAQIRKGLLEKELGYLELVAEAVL